MRTVSRRLDYVDVMKGIAIFLVVAGHVLAGCKSESMSGWNVMVLWNFIYEFHMPLFMFISGFVCFNPSKQYTWVMMVKRCISYLIPFFMGGLLIGIMRQNMDIEILWYFRTLCVLAVTLFVSIKLCSVIFGKIRLQVVYVALVAIVYFIMIQMLCALCERFSFCDLIIDSGHFQWLYIYLFFLLGWLLRALPMLDIYVRNDYMLVLSFAGVLILSVFEFPLSSLFKIACLITFVLNISSIPKMKECKYLLNLGGVTGEIYIIHIFLALRVPIVGDWFLTYHDQGVIFQVIPQLVYVIPMSLISIYVSYKITEIISQSPLSSFLLFGKLDFLNKINENSNTNASV